MFKKSLTIRKSLKETKGRIQSIFHRNKCIFLKEPLYVDAAEKSSLADEPLGEEQPLPVWEDPVLSESSALETPVQNEPLFNTQTSPSTNKKFRCDLCSNQGAPQQCDDEGREQMSISNDYTPKMVFEDKIGIYKNCSSPRGLVFMQNFEHFEELDLPHRKGSDLDYKNMMSLFTQMGYKCDESNWFCRSGRITRDECLATLQRFSSLSEHENLDSCLIAIMSHGSGDKTFISSDGKEIRVKDICKILNNVHGRTLRGKPKVCIFQFCRKSAWRSSDEDSDHSGAEEFNKVTVRPVVKQGRRSRKESLSFMSFTGSTNSLNLSSNPGRVVSDISSTSVFSDTGYEETTNRINSCSVIPTPPEDEDTWNANLITANKEKNHSKEFPPITYDADSSSVALPSHDVQINSDFFLVFSTIAGEVSYRHPRSGSILIQAICYIFGRNVHSDNIDSLFKKVSLYMKNEIPINDQDHFVPQTCERINIGFDKDFYFNPEETTNVILKALDRM